MSDNIGRQFKYIGGISDLVGTVLEIHSYMSGTSYTAIIIEKVENGRPGHNCEGMLPIDAKGYFVSVDEDDEYDGFWNMLNDKNWQEVNVSNDFWEVN